MQLFIPVTAWAKPAHIIIVGDSLSAGYGIDLSTGWVALLQKKLDQLGYPYKVINSSISGLARLNQLLKNKVVSLVIIELGGNDGLRGLAPAEINKNLSEMVAQAKKHNAQVLLLGVRLPPNYGPAYTRQFHRVYMDVASQHAVKLVPFFLAGVDDQTELMQSDGIHPNQKAQTILLENVWKYLQPMLEVNNIASGKSQKLN
jgi:acyl-CoA thioesterase I